MLTFSPHIDGIGFLYCAAVFVGIIQYGDSYHLRPIGVFHDTTISVSDEVFQKYLYPINLN